MCLSLRLRCLLLLNGGRQGDCVRVEFWLRETLLQRLLPVVAARRTHANCPEAVVGHGDWRWPEWRLCEVLRS